MTSATRTRAGHHHESHTPTSPKAVLLGKMACQPKHFGRQCMHTLLPWIMVNLYNVSQKLVGICPHVPIRPAALSKRTGEKNAQYNPLGLEQMQNLAKSHQNG